MLLSFKIIYKSKTKKIVSIFGEKMNKYFNVILKQELKYKFSDCNIEISISCRAKHVHLASNRPLTSFDYEF